MRLFLLLLVLAVAAVYGCIQQPSEKNEQVNEVVTMKISSSVFENNGSMPSKYTCDGSDVSPELRIAGVPGNAKSLALVMDDPDAPSKVWEHWTVFNIPPTTTVIPENSVPEGAIEATNDFRRTSYGGPCPPSGTHRYHFKLYALDTELNLDSSATKKGVEAAMKGHVLAEATLIGLYKRA